MLIFLFSFQPRWPGMKGEFYQKSITAHADGNSRSIDHVQCVLVSEDNCYASPQLWTLSVFAERGMISYATTILWHGLEDNIVYRFTLQMLYVMCDMFSVETTNNIYVHKTFYKHSV